MGRNAASEARREAAGERELVIIFKGLRVSRTNGDFFARPWARGGGFTGLFKYIGDQNEISAVNFKQIYIYGATFGRFFGTQYMYKKKHENLVPNILIIDPLFLRILDTNFFVFCEVPTLYINGAPTSTF